MDIPVYSDDRSIVIVFSARDGSIAGPLDKSLVFKVVAYVLRSLQPDICIRVAVFSDLVRQCCKRARAEASGDETPDP